MLDGEGAVKSSEATQQLNKVGTILVDPNEQHCFINATEKPLRFICVIPIVKE
ncbi:hypothetical protein ACFLS8_05120 [Chloroflexota bacterium]